MGGRAMLSRLYQDCLRELLGGDLTVHRLAPAPPRRLTARLAALRGRIDGVTRAAEAEVLDRSAASGAATVFLDGSNPGRLVQALKAARPDIRVITLFHNVEADFFRSALAHRPTPHAAAVWLANRHAERLAVRGSDVRIALCRRDSERLHHLYGRGASAVIPLAMADRSTCRPAGTIGAGEGYFLFVGGNFYANREGIGWFAREVAPALSLPTKVIGHGLGDLRAELERGGKVQVIGAGDDLEPWYHGAKAVIAPIFAGSGMKTKVAEALMHGKRVVGTSEAFAGYGAASDSGAAWICDAREAWIACLGEISNAAAPRFDSSARTLFDQSHGARGLTAALSRLVDLPRTTAAAA
jgi:hypothetical protein